MRRTVFIGSWKAHKTVSEVEQYLSELTLGSSAFTSEIALCPAACYLEKVGRHLPVTIKLGAQDVSRFGSGPHTGEITASMLASLKVKYCIVGHVERRVDNCEENAHINQKMKQLLSYGIIPVLCVGETLAEYDNNMTNLVIEKQVLECLDGIKELDKIIISYQPIWTIGTGYYATGDYCNIVAGHIRKVIQKMTGNAMSANFPILYGGMVTASNAKEYLECPEIDGLMVGVAALKVKDFADICNTKFTVKKYELI